LEGEMMEDSLKSAVMVKIAKELKVLRKEFNEAHPNKLKYDDTVWELMEKIMLLQFEKGFDEGVSCSINILQHMRGDGTLGGI
jgi:hypothetical protein